MKYFITTIMVLFFLPFCTFSQNEDFIKYSGGIIIGANGNFYQNKYNAINMGKISTKPFNSNLVLGVFLTYNPSPKFQFRPQFSLSFLKPSTQQSDFKGYLDNSSFSSEKYGFQNLNFGLEGIKFFKNKWNLNFGLYLIRTSLVNFTTRIRLIPNTLNQGTVLINQYWTNSELMFKKIDFSLSFAIEKRFDKFSIGAKIFIPKFVIPEYSYKQEIITDNITIQSEVNYHLKALITQLYLTYNIFQIKQK